MKIIGVTGSIATGKSYATKQFAMPYFSSDEAVAELLKEPQIIAKIMKEIPEFKDNFDISLLAQIVFDNKYYLRKLERILYPEINKKRNKVIKQARLKKKNYIFLEIPLLFEKKLEKLCDQVILVVANKNLQRKQALKRKNMNDQKLNNISANQMSQPKKKTKADHIIYNNFTKSSLKIQINQLWESFEHARNNNRY